VGCLHLHATLHRTLTQELGEDALSSIREILGNMIKCTLQERDPMTSVMTLMPSLRRVLQWVMIQLKAPSGGPHALCSLLVFLFDTTQELDTMLINMYKHALCPCSAMLIQSFEELQAQLKLQLALGTEEISVQVLQVHNIYLALPLPGE
jgi:hypothetical protein